MVKTPRERMLARSRKKCRQGSVIHIGRRCFRCVKHRKKRGGYKYGHRKVPCGSKPSYRAHRRYHVKRHVKRHDKGCRPKKMIPSRCGCRK